MFSLSKRVYLFMIFFLSCFIALPLFVSPVQVEAATFTHVYGKVVDSITRNPLSDAYIIFHAEAGSVTKVKTNVSGTYDANVFGLGPYWVYAYCDIPSTPGFDYVPACQEVSLQGLSLNISFALLHGASISATGDLQDLRSMEFLKPPTMVSFIVIDQFGLLNGTDSVTKYGESFAVNRLLGIDSRTVVVPSNTPVKVEANLYYVSWSEPRRFTIDSEGDYLNLAQGDSLTVNLRKFASRAEIDYTHAYLQSVQAMVDEAVEAGFYVSYEGIRLSGAEDLVKAARSALDEGDYDSVYANLHEAYLIVKDIEESLPSIYESASKSVFFITPFLGFTAVATASVLLDDSRRRLVVSLALYGILLGSLYFIYPGYATIQKTAYNPWAGTAFEGLITFLLVGASFLVAFFMVQGLPYLFKEKTSAEELRFISAVAAAFSVAARNLKRRRLRTLLTSTFMLVSVFAFVLLTSLSFEHGFFIQSYHGQAPSKGFLIRKHPISDPMPFKPIEPAILRWLTGRSESTLVVPKIENTPQVGQNAPPSPLATLHAPKLGSRFDILGALGVYPSLEVNVTKIDSIVTQGRFLSDEDLNGILISEEAAKTLQAEVNSTLQFLGRSFTVNGIFNSGKLGGLRDLDGAPILPRQITVIIVPMGGPSYKVEYVPSEMVVILHGETAQSLGMVISRIDAQTQSSEEVIALARLAVLIWPDVQAFASTAGEICHLFVGSSYVIKGFAEGMVPLILVVLNIGLMMLSAVYERKREAVTMSTVGLNPFHISAVFVAEALTLGVVAGSLGYLLGLISYRLLALFAVSFEVKQKVEAFWGVFALGFSIVAATLGSLLPAIKASIIATPSLIRKWKIRIEERPRTAKEPWVLKIPIIIQGEDLEKFFSFMEKRLERYTSNMVERVEDLNVYGEGAAIRLSFTYVFSEKGIVTENELIPVKNHIPNRYTIKLTSQSRIYRVDSYSGKPGDEAHIRQTATFIRHLILQYSYEHQA